MNILDRIAAYAQHGDRVERARDPDTHEPLPSFEPTPLVKLGAWFAKTPWARRQVLKWITAGSAILAAWLASHGGSEHSAAITAGAVAAFTFIYEQVISYLCSRAKITPPAWEEDEPEPPTHSIAAVSPFAPVVDFARPSFFTKLENIKIENIVSEPEQITPQPRIPRRTLPLGPKGVKIIAEQMNAEASKPDVVRGTLRAEADDGQVVIVQTDDGLVSLERSEWEIYVKAETP